MYGIFLQNSHALRNSGSFALDLAYVAAGRYDAAILEDFDFKKVAAGIVISQESGALIGDLKGNPNVFDASSIVSATAKCFKPLIKTLNSDEQLNGLPPLNRPFAEQ